MQHKLGARRPLGRTALAAVVGLIVAACGTGGVTSSPSASSPPATAPVASPAPSAAKTYQICINQFVTVSVTSDELKGIKEALPGLGLADGGNAQLNVQNPEADVATNQTLAQQFVDQKCDIMVGFATPGAQVLHKVSATIPIVFVGVSNPVQAGIVASLEQPGGNVTGVADRLPVEQEIDAMLQIKPTIKTIGLIWTTGDNAGEVHVTRARDHITQLGLKYVEAPITAAADAVQSAQSLVGRVDAIQIPCDGPALSAVPAIVKVGDGAKIPVFGCSGEAVSKGAMLAGDYDYVKVGNDAAKLIADILLNGQNPGSMPVVVPPLLGMELNVTKAKLLGLTIPPALLSAAPKTY